MAAQKNTTGRVRLIYRRSSVLLKCVLLSCIVLSTAALCVLGASVQTANRRAEQLEVRAALLQQDNQELAERIAELGSAESVKQIAMEVLGLVDPDAVFYCPVEPENP